MKVILVDQRHGHTKTIVLKGWLKGLLSLCLLGTPVALGYFGYQFAVSQNSGIFTEESARNWEQQIRFQAEQLTEIKQESEEQLEALTLRLAMLQARLVRLDAVGERVTSIANLDTGEFNFSEPVALGGPLLGDTRAPTSNELMDSVYLLERQLEDRQQQLQILESLMTDRKIQSDVFLAGRPVNNGWIASRFGQRLDPITGQLAFHGGVDFTTGKAGAEINTVAAGVITWSGPRTDYGLMVEVNHGNGFTTRYAHSEKVLVEVGDIVKKGQNIALVGSTGRSTGPHVHFEVYKNGRIVDPAAYIHRTAR
ncbi:MAG: M23 family metallopeptidase [Gammaproteobacteria bacterium]|jgi:murein DD-endopeptidase MepM/ murein hydrolase activator NlpD|nr:M23 family metallopeptidase [Gammaproteobacteria bacterium]MBT3859960.1 M23 family metallopeptidase [Gammaproteobacteria bacterium]MBT3986422.1 M23 family metallopeptidase [Gammaproteobacteria bacterium]MBT4256158.1 M23 family metallopeptidase [Gammaproteobacteria bacterium]MBT4582982.1 M23 family metallopeptidase [Gammaproteobacteria bacterium]